MNQQSLKNDIDASLEGAVLTDDQGFNLPELNIRGDGLNNRSATNETRDSNALSIGLFSISVYYDGTYQSRAGSTTYLSDSTTKELISAVTDIISNDGASEGELSDYGLFYRVESTSFGWNFAFASSDDYNARVLSFWLQMLLFWSLLMVALFIITLYLSRLVTKPIAKAWQDQQRFIADASHELKTPLTVILADVSILQENQDSTIHDQQQWVEGIIAEADHMKELTESMLTLAQVDTGIDMSKLMNNVDYSRVVEGCVLQFEAVAFERDLSIEDEVEEGIYVHGDEMRLEAMVKTLMENACKYSAKPGIIGVRLKAEKNNAVMTVYNDGDPIPAEDLPHLFDRFYRSDKARTREKETASFGLGLSIAKSTVELHQGTIAVDSDEGGTTFTVRIPLAH